MGLNDNNNGFAPANLRFHVFRRLVQPWAAVGPPDPSAAPVVIGAIGGSGTRVIAQTLELAGFWMGAWINPKTHDAMATRHFLQRHFEHLVEDPGAEDPGMRRDFARAIQAHRWGAPAGGPWGWKNPRSMWIIPFLAHAYRRLKFIHIVRDGRDMALSGNTNLMRKHGRFLLGEALCRQEPVRARVGLWTLGNSLARREGMRLLGSNYLVVRYEDLCFHPSETVDRVFTHLGVEVSPEVRDLALRLIVPPRSIGQWRATHHEALRAPDPEVCAALESFGYETPRDPKTAAASAAAAT